MKWMSFVGVVGLMAACSEPGGGQVDGAVPGPDGGVDAGLVDAGGAGDASTLADAGPVVDAGWYSPGVSTTWQWQLTGTLNTSYDVDLYDVDLFDTDISTIAALQAQGRAVVCYFSAGSGENWRPDYGQFAPQDLGSPLDGWPGERWLDIRSATVRAVMAGRLDLAATKGCDGVEPDNVDGYTNNPGHPFTAADQLAYNRWLADEAHSRLLGIGLKNDLDQVADLVAWFDFAVNEECHDWSECGMLDPFITAGKPVFNAEYADDLSAAQAAAASICPASLAANLRTLILPWDLDDSFRVSCD